MSTKPTIARRQDRGYSNAHPEDNHRVIESYYPRTDRESWDAVKDFVRAAVTPFADESKPVVQNYMTTVKKFAVWAHKRGLPMDALDEVLSTPFLVRYTADVLDKGKTSTRHTQLALLRLVVERSGQVDENYSRKPRVMDYLEGREIYSEAEKTRFYSSCNSRSTEKQRNNMRVYVALGFGAGLTSKEMNILRVEHIVQEASHVAVHVPGKNARVVPVRAEWATLLLRGLETRFEGDYALSGYRDPQFSKTLATGIAAATPSEPHPNPTRMRATWIVDLLVSGLRQDVVCEVAGIGTDALRTYLQRMPPYDFGDYVELIVGATR
ncbi:site-specific integrase [Leifsonia shinshuensis]|uniref:Site-specific integrase n=1 Tax=Leifsonia shinshuensis TaxID=150026 RepID=A0A7G6YBM1_9MICO|nr:site-specific integrase [Leifsonia shinshuensis]QNE35886.1 site-specific integrase [Leifsonia shinshuensis]